ncbi:dehydrogenase, partial [Cordylochernes scorpioides]
MSCLSYSSILFYNRPGETQNIMTFMDWTTIVRDYDGRIFSRHYDGGMLVGGFEKISKPVLMEEIPESFVFTKFPPDWNQFREERLFPPRPTFHKPAWFDRVQEEYLACRERVGVIDMSSFSKFIIKSPGQEVVEFLQKLCSNDVDIPTGTIVPTGMQNQEGGYVNDCLLLRQHHNWSPYRVLSAGPTEPSFLVSLLLLLLLLSHLGLGSAKAEFKMVLTYSNDCCSYFMMSPTAQITRLTEWMSRFVNDFKGAVSLSDVTSMYTVLNVVGPKSRELLRELTRNPNMNIPSFTYQTIGCVQYALHLYNCLMSVGQDYGIRNVGYYALRFLRIEKFIPFYGEELDSTVTPFEVGRGLKVKLKKPDFLGKQALVEQTERGVNRRLVHFQLDEEHKTDTDLWPWGSEPILRNGVPVGAVTSSGYGFTLGRVVCLGFVRHPDNLPVTPDFIIDRTANFEIEIAGQRFRAKASLHPPNIPVVAMGGANT